MARTTIYVGTNDGVVTLTGGGAGWEAEHQGVRGWNIEEVGIDPSNPARVLAGTRGDGVWVSEDRGKNWSKPCYGRPGPGKVRCLTFDPRDSRRVFAGGEPIELWVTDDLGRNWDRVKTVRELPFIDNVDYPVPTVEPHLRDIAVDPSDPNTIYAALQVGGMIKTTDAGKTWKLIENDNELDCDVHTIVVDADHTNVVIVATGGHDSRGGRVKGRALYRSADGGETWTPVAMEFDHEYSVPLVANPHDPHTLYAGLAHGTPGSWRRPTGAEGILVRSTNGGKTWTEVDTGFDETSRDFPQAVAFDPEDPNRVYLALRSGLLTSADGGNSWERLDARVSGITDIKVARA